MTSKKWLFIFFLLTSCCYAQKLPVGTPAKDQFSGLVGASCPARGESNTSVPPSQLVTTSVSAITPGVTTTIALASTVEQNGIVPNGRTVQPGEFVTLDYGAGGTNAVTGETPSGSFAVFGGTNGSGKWFGDGVTTTFQAYFAHASVLQNTVTVLVGGSPVAVDVNAGIQSGSPSSWALSLDKTSPCPLCSNNAGDVTGFVSPDLYDGRQVITLYFTVAPVNNAAISLNYSYATAEVLQVSSVSSPNVTFTTPIYNAHSGMYSVVTASFGASEITGAQPRWTFCDPLGHREAIITSQNLNTQGNWENSGASPFAQNSVTTTLTQNVTGSSSPQCVGVASTSEIVPGPGMIVGVGTPQSDPNREWVRMLTPSGCSAGQVYGTFKNSHATGDRLACCQQSTVVNASDGQGTGGPVPAQPAGKYRGSSYAQLANANSAPGGSWLPLHLLRVRNYEITGASPAGSQGNFDPWLTNGSAGIWNLPETTSPVKDPSYVYTQECQDGLKNRFGFAGDIILSGNTSHNAVGSIPDFVDPNLGLWIAGQMGDFPESPFTYAVNPNQTDNCPGSGPGEHFTTSPQNGFQAFSEAKKILVAPAHIGVPFAVLHNTAQQQGSPVSQRGTYLTKAVFLPQYLQGQYDPINFPTPATGSNISLISCNGANVNVTVSSAWIGSHILPFSIGELVSVSATGFSTSPGSPAQVIIANQSFGARRITLAYPVTSPCPGASTQTTGLLAVGPGYNSISALNTAWGTGGFLTTFGTSGTQTTGVPVSCSLVSGHTYYTCNATANQNIDPYSVSITASNGTISSNIAWDFWHSSSGEFVMAYGDSGSLDEPRSFSTNATSVINPITGSCLTFTSCATFSLASYSDSSSGYTIVPGQIFKVTDGTNVDYVVVSSVQHATAPQGMVQTPGSVPAYGATTSVTAGPFTHTYASGVGTTFSSVFGSTPSATPINTDFTYAAASPGTITVQFYLDNQPPASFSLTMSYWRGGYMDPAGYSGLLDISGTCNSSAGNTCPTEAFTGNDLGCFDPGSQASGNCFTSNYNSNACKGSGSGASICFGNATFVRDMDGAAQTARQRYARMYKEDELSVMPHTMVLESYRNAGARGDPARWYDILNQAPFVDIMEGSFVERFDGATTLGAQFPCLANSSNQCPQILPTSTCPASGWTLCQDPSLGPLDYLFTIAGNKPMYDFSEIPANPQSSLECIMGVGTRAISPGCPNEISGQTDGFVMNLTCQAGCLTVNTTLTQAVTGSTSPQTVTVASTSGIAVNALLGIGVSTAAGSNNPEIVQVTALGSGNITGIFLNNHTNGANVTAESRANFASAWLQTIFQTPTVDNVFHFVGDDWWSCPSDTPLAGGQYDAYGCITVNDNLYDGIESCNASAQPPFENVGGFLLQPVPENPTNGSCYADFLDPWEAAMLSVDASISGAATIAPTRRGFWSRVDLASPSPHAMKISKNTTTLER